MLNRDRRVVPDSLRNKGHLYAAIALVTLFGVATANAGSIVIRADELTNSTHNKLVMLPDGSVAHLARLRLAALNKVYQPGDTLVFDSPGSTPKVISNTSPSEILLQQPLIGGLFPSLNVARDVSILEPASGYFFTALSGFPYSAGALDGTNRLIYVGTPIQPYTTYQPANNPFQPPCNQVLSLTTGEWRQISMPCNPGTADTVADVFGDDLTGTYGTDWILYRRDEDATPPAYVALGLGDSLAVGEGYWIKTLETGNPSVDISGIDNTLTKPALTGVAAAAPAGCAGSAGQCNMAGHPHNFNVCWADVQVKDGGTTFSLSQADTAGIMDREAHKWTGSAYQAFDGAAPGLQGTLEPWDGFWASANKAGIELIIPATAATGSCEPAPEPSRAADGKGSPAHWYIRLIAESGNMIDRGNVFGQAQSSVDGYDPYDLQELDPFGNDYLTVVFPHADWDERSGNYTSDYRSYKTTRDQERWDFEVHASDPEAEVKLRWEGGDERLAHSVLVDRATNMVVRPGADVSYAFRMKGQTRQFTWYYGMRRGGDITLLLNDAPAPQSVAPLRYRSKDELSITLQ